MSASHTPTHPLSLCVFLSHSLTHTPPRYFSSGLYRLREFVDYSDAETVADLNTIAHAHVLTIDVDLDSRFTYNGVDVTDDGKLRILFEPEYLDTNISSALDRDVLKRALNDADKDEAGTGLSFIARQTKRKEFDAQFEAVRKEIGEALAKPDIKLTPNLEDTFAKLKADAASPKTQLDKKYWEEQLPSWTLKYFEGLLSQLKWQKFNEDDMLQEGFNDAVDSGEIAFRIVDSLKEKSYCEFEIDGGVFYLQTTVKTWGTNIDAAAEGIVDKL